MPFDPSLPFEEVDETDAIGFDTVSKPKTTGFDFNQPFEEVEIAEDQSQFDTDYFKPKPLRTEKEKQEIGTIEGITNAAKNAFDSSRQAIAVVGGVSPEEAKDISKIEYNKQARKLAPGYDEYQKAEGWDAAFAFAKNPIEVTSNIIAEGLAGSLPALGAGLTAGGVGAAAGSVVPVLGTGAGFVAGQVAGTFAGSLATEYGSKVLEELQGEGMDIADPNSIQTFFGNEELVSKARDKALKRGVPIAAFDALSAGIGGKLGRVFGTKVITEGEKIIGKQFATKAGEAATELGVQAALGGGGEIAGALAVGEPIEGKAVFGEAIGEVGTGGIEVITGRIADKRAMAKAQEDAKIKAAADLSMELEANSSPLTAKVITAKSAANIEQDKLAAQLEEELSLTVTKPTAAPPTAIPTKEDYVARYSAIARTAPEELTRAEQSFTNELAAADTEEKRINAQNALDAIKEVKTVGITPAAQPPVTPVTQPPITDATQEIIQPEGVRQEPQDRTKIGEKPETIISDSLLGAEGIQEEGQVDPIVVGLQAIANNTATREQIASLSLSGLVDVRRGQAIINEDGEGILAQAQAPLPTLTPEERAAEVEVQAEIVQPTLRELVVSSGIPDEAADSYIENLKSEGLDESQIGEMANNLRALREEANLKNEEDAIRRRDIAKRARAGDREARAELERERGIVTEELTIGEIPQISPIIGEQPAEPIISEIPTTSEIVGEEPATIVEQEQVAPAKQPTVSTPISGQPFEFFSIRNKEKAPQLGSQFGQDIEPSGKYVSQSTPSAAKNLDERFEKEAVRFENPLVVEFGGEYGTPTNWKSVLSSQYGGKTGTELSQAIRNAGYDGIVTVEPAKGPNRPASTSEIVDIRSIQPTTTTPTPTEAMPSTQESFGQRMLNAINEKIAQGKDVFISTMTQSTKVNKKAIDNWNKAGKPLFKVGKDGNLYIGSGKRYDQLTSAEMSLVGFSSEGKKLVVSEPASAQKAPAAPSAEPVVKISRGENFSMDGEYNVSIGDKKYRIYRDSGSGYWYDADVQFDIKSPELGSPSLGLLSTETRKDAIAELVNEYKKEQSVTAPVSETPAITPAAEVASAEGAVKVSQLTSEINEKLLRGTPSQNDTMYSLYAELGSELDPDIRLSDQQSLGMIYASVLRGDVTIDEFIKYHNEIRNRYEDLRNIPSGVESKIQPVSLANVEKGLQGTKRETGKKGGNASGEGVMQGIEIPKLRTISRREGIAGPTAKGQTLAANKASRIAVLTSLNKVVGEPFVPSELERIQDSQIDEIRDWLIERNNQMLRGQSPSPTPSVLETITPAEPAGISIGNRIKLGKSPQTYTIEEIIPQTKAEVENDEQFYSVKNERTGEVQVVEARDLKPVKKMPIRKAIADAVPTPDDKLVPAKDIINAVIKMFGKDFVGEYLTLIDDVNEKAKAAYEISSGTIYINRAYISKGDNIRDYIAHELGHYIAGDPTMTEKFQEFFDSLPAKDKAILDRFVENVYNDETGEVRLEEKQVYAFIIRLNAGENRNAFQTLMDAIKKWLNKNFKTKFKMTDRDAAAILAGAVERFKSGEFIPREEGFGSRKAAGISNMDSEYLAAVERGDMETAQRMVDEAAKAAMPKSVVTEPMISSKEKLADKPLLKVYHGTYAQFNVFERGRKGVTDFGFLGVIEDERHGIFFAENKDFAKTFAKSKGGDRVVPAFLNITMPFEFQDAQSIIESRELGSEFSIDYNMARWFLSRSNKWEAFDGADGKAFVDWLESKGFDGVRIQEEGIGLPDEPTQDVWVALSPSQIKSSDPVTYDDAGNVIPLSQRFRPVTSDIRYAKAVGEPRREQVAGEERGDIITTPEGIIKQTNEVLRNKFFDGSVVSDENTSAAWDYIEQLLDTESGAAYDLAGQINNVVDQETNSKTRMGAGLFSVSLANYAAKLAVQGNTTMISYLVRRINSMPTDNRGGTATESGRVLRGKREYSIDGYKTLETEHDSKVERTAAALFGTGKPSEEQVAAVDAAIKASEDTPIGEAEEVAGEVEKVEKRTGRKVIKKIEGKIQESTEPKKEELLISFQNLNADKKIKGITLTYNPQKISPVKSIQNFIIGKLVDYRKTLINQGASGLESTFWQTMSANENKLGPLGEIDQAQNNELAKIVQKTLVDLGLKGEPPNTKMTDIEKVASILNKQKLSDEKRIEADQRIVGEIERRRESELASGSIPEAVNAKYDAILGAWNQSMSRQLNMPVSDNMLQRLINAELKEQNKNVNNLIDEADGKVVAKTKQDIVDSIIRKIYGVSKESEAGIEMDENYDGLKGYLEQTLDNMYALQVEKRNAAYADRQAKISLRNNVEGQAQSIIDQLADQLSDTPAFPEKQENQVKAIVQQDLRQRPDMKRKQPWTSQLTAKLMQTGVSEAQAETISNLVWRQHEIKAMDRELKELQMAAEKGSLAVIIRRIKDTPLEEQQKPGWMQEVVREYLIEAGLSSQAADTAARLYESVIAERFAEAKQKAFEATLAKSAPWNNYLSRNAQLGKNALKKIQDAIRTGVLDPTQTTEGIIAKENGWSGFSKEQLTRIVQLDGILSDDANNQVDKAEAMSELNKIIVKAKMPVRFKDAIGAYYVAQALMGIPTLLVNIVSPIGFSVRNMITDIGKYSLTEPSRIPMAFETFLDSMKSWYNQTSYAFKNQIYMNDVVEYLQGQNVLRELFDKGKEQWAKGDYANGMANMLVGMTQITGRVLSSLDQGAISALENQNISRYAMEAMKQNNIPQNKRKEFANMILHMRRQTYAEAVANGMEGDRAGVLADFAVRNEIVTGLSGMGVRDKVLDSAINDALQTVGRNKTIDIDKLTETTKKLSDVGILSYWPISFLEKIASGAAKEGPGMQVFSKMLYGFALVPARVFHTTAWYSPYGFVRLAIDKYKKNKGYESPYAMSLQTELQYKQRLTETIAGSVVMLGLAALAGSSTDDDEEKMFRIVITGNGPSYNADKQYYDAWHKKYKPYSFNIVIGKTIIPINIGRGGEALFFPIMLAGALDDWKIKEKLNLAKKEPKELNLAVETLGSAFFALAQRGPYSAFSKPLFDATQSGKITEELVGQAGFFGKTFVPIIGSSLSRNISDFINDPVDRSSLQGAIYANTPVVGPWIGTKALNALGQPMRADDWGDKLFKLGVPVVFSFPKNTPENELNELILKKGSGPSIPTRSNAQKRFGDVLTDKEFETYVREYGRVVSDKMFKNRKKLENMSVKNYDDELEGYVRGYSVGDTKITGAADMAVRAVKRSRNE